MSKIDDFVKEHNTKPSDCVYHTNRSIKSIKGTGSIRVLVPKTDSIARCEYVCPECKHAAYTEVPWKRPFYVKCEKCSAKISVPRIRDEAKRERKLESKK
jgi:peptide subunit release factor 1 (eRF1)